MELVRVVFMGRDFTAVEMFSVAVIFAILFLLGYFRWMDGIEQQNRDACKHNLTQIGKVLDIYASDMHFGVYPDVGPMGRSGARGLYANGQGILNGPEYFRCPSAGIQSPQSSPQCDYLRSWWNHPGTMPVAVVAGDFQLEDNPSVGNHNHSYSNLLLRDGGVVGWRISKNDPNLRIPLRVSGAPMDYIYATGEPGMSMSTHAYLHWND